MELKENRSKLYIEGVKAGIPIGLGYFAVAFSLGIAARDYGFNAFQGFIASLFTYASAGQYIGFSLYAANGTLLTLIVLTAITNLRYILMGFALNQGMPAGTPLGTRMLVGTCITDEIFSVTIARPGIPFGGTFRNVHREHHPTCEKGPRSGLRDSCQLCVLLCL